MSVLGSEGYPTPAPAPAIGTAGHLDEGKPRLELLPNRGLRDVGDAFAYGERKYGPKNWTRGMPWRKLAGSALRHIYAWAWGEDFDPESGVHHLAHACCNLLMLLDYRHRQELAALDDRDAT